MELEKDLDNISRAILDLLQLVTYEAVRAYTFRVNAYAEMLSASKDYIAQTHLRKEFEKEKEYSKVLEYMLSAFREMKETEEQE